ncbi:MAG TPA: enoyl-CoA hydratase/isomerase family protein [Xanthobacteraceae bacterium]|nr:enoyl-CoA hydratase/isomerase family protein [Xanthobacteraceae bacterium]
MLGSHFADGVAVLTLSHPPVNAISEEWVARFERELDGLSGQRDWKILHIRSDQKVFCAGADLREIHVRMDNPNGADRMYGFAAGIQRLFERIERLPQVTVAEIAGAAMGGGLELALACDLRVAADGAQLGLPEARLGLVPGAGGTQRLTKLCGRAVASRLILGAEVIDARTAFALGVVHWVFAPTELQRQTVEIVRRIAALPGSALAAAKVCIAAAAEPGRSGYSDELEATRRLLTDAETRRRVHAFLAGRTDVAMRRDRGAA